MRLDVTDDDIGTRRLAPSGLEHCKGLADTGGRAEKNAQPSTLGARLLGLNVRQHPIRIRP